jgi:hypothetical protein
LTTFRDLQQRERSAMGKLFGTPKVSVTPPPSAEAASEDQTKKLEKAHAVRTRALNEVGGYQGQFIRKTGLRL